MKPTSPIHLACAALLAGAWLAGCRTELPPPAFPADRGLRQANNAEVSGKLAPQPAPAPSVEDAELAAAVKAFPLSPTPGDPVSVKRLFSSVKPAAEARGDAPIRAVLTSPVQVEVREYMEWDWWRDPWWHDHWWSAGPDLRAEALMPGTSGQNGNGPVQFRVGVRDDPRDVSGSSRWRVIEWGPGK